MTSRIRFYMTFDAEWIQTVECPNETLRDLLEDGFDLKGEAMTSFEYHDGVAIINLVSNRDCEMLEEMVCEILLTNLDNFHESDLDIEIDLDVEVMDDYDF